MAVSVVAPAKAAPLTLWGAGSLSGANPEAQALKAYILSPAGQAVLASNGFSPAAASVPEPASAAVLGLTLAAVAAARRRSAADAHS